MNKSENIDQLAKALVKVQAALQPAAKDAANPFFKSSYASLNSVWDACRSSLAENGLAVTQLNQLADNGVIIETVLMHVSGQWISGEMLLPLAKHDAQGVGSAVSYGRRYGLAAIVGIVADADDDGNHASGKVEAKTNGKVEVKPNGKPSEIDRLKKVVWMAAQELGWNLDDLNAYTQDFFGGDYPVAKLNEKQLNTVSIELSKKLGETAKEVAA